MALSSNQQLLLPQISASSAETQPQQRKSSSLLVFNIKMCFIITVIIFIVISTLVVKINFISTIRLVAPLSFKYNDRKFTCSDWSNLSYINAKKYQLCLKWRQDHSFWGVMNIRHTIHKGFINSSSLIVEIGGNIGEDSSRFIKLYNCSLIIYEPLIPIYKDLVKKFQNNSKVEVHPYGMGNRARKILIEPYAAHNEGTSMFRKITKYNSSTIQHIEIINVVEAIEKIRRTRTKDGMIDMLSVNCEGCEFEVLPSLINNNLIKYFRNIQFATHVGFLRDTSCIYCQIEQSLEITHRTRYHYKLVWEGWTLKNETSH
ncbi:unnamed protein product [Didymodactylos carnosus]|uniref:Methyltransferase FkbM domain-containing protein n=1 Tax=Didymodactylos carnosus TaxID=1234261 RepID=A0A814XYJ7_9BILA|nr:unnamed protein product [Didymodactylos carnosus]CAF3985464.1 unnamed protein product [Didymodactylos carnosus]